MRKDRLRAILADIQKGNMTVSQALEALKRLPFEDVSFANIDHHRALRKGFPEVVFCRGKTARQVVTILQRIAQAHEDYLATRVDPETARVILEKIPGSCYHQEAGIVTSARQRHRRGPASILVVSAGTSDIPVAEEAAVTAEVIGQRVERLYDVGVAGLHRLLGHWDKFRQARVIIVVAGMEGALASVIGGLVAVPVIAVPTSVGYGASFGGVTALLAMLNSCAAGVTVVNIDNGFGAGYAAALMLSAAKQTRSGESDKRRRRGRK